MAEFKALDDAMFEATANTAKGGRAVSARYDRRRRRLVLRLTGGLDVAFNPRRVPGLEAASDDDLADVGVEGAGRAIRFNRIDADYSVSRLLDLFLQFDPAAA